MRYLTLLLTLLFIPSCAQVPKEASYPMTHQEKMQASEHWRFLAKDISKQVVSTICPEAMETAATGLGPNLSPELSYKSPIQGFQATCSIKDAFFISVKDQSPFGKAMWSFLKTELTSKGLTINSNPQSPYQLSWKVERVFHKAERVSGHSGLFVGLGEVLQFLIAGNPDNADSTKPHSEIIITYELKNRETKRDILHDTRIYYINDVDMDHYEVSNLNPIRYDVTNR